MVISDKETIPCMLQVGMWTATNDSKLNDISLSINFAASRPQEPFTDLAKHTR